MIKLGSTCLIYIYMYMYICITDPTIKLCYHIYYCNSKGYCGTHIYILYIIKYRFVFSSLDYCHVYIPYNI